MFFDRWQPIVSGTHVMPSAATPAMARPILSMHKLPLNLTLFSIGEGWNIPGPMLVIWLFCRLRCSSSGEYLRTSPLIVVSWPASIPKTLNLGKGFRSSAVNDWIGPGWLQIPSRFGKYKSMSVGNKLIGWSRIIIPFTSWFDLPRKWFCETPTTLRVWTVWIILGVQVCIR